MKTLAETLEDYLMNESLSYTQFSKRSGLSVHMLTNIGKHKPQIKTYSKLAKALNIPARELMKLPIRKENE